VLRSRSLAVRALVQASRLLRARLAMRCPGSGPSVRSSGSRCGTIAPVLPRISAGEPEPTAGGEIGRRLRSLLAASQWIAETSAVVRPILRGPSPHSLPIESPLVPGAGRGPFRRGARNWGVPDAKGGPGWDRGLGPDHSDGRAWRQREGLSPGGGQGGDSVGTGHRCPALHESRPSGRVSTRLSFRSSRRVGGPLTHSLAGMNLLS
jgi:hypothetical protein